MAVVESEPYQGGEGFGVAYAPEKAGFRFYAMAGAAVIALAAFVVFRQPILFLIALPTAGAAYYFYPLVNTKKTRFGAGQYGVFVEGLGLIPWREIESVDVRLVAVRTIQVQELQIRLNRPIAQALMANWQKLPIWRALMRLPWAMPDDKTIRIKLEPFPIPPEKLLEHLRRMRRYYARTIR